jgi:hypothetical protein
MMLGETEHTSHGLALGAWGASQATSAGLAIALGGTLRDWINTLAMRGDLGETLATPGHRLFICLSPRDRSVDRHARDTCPTGANGAAHSIKI